jgi:hypothetical protein
LFAALGWHVLLKLVGEARDGQGLEPNAAGTGEGREEDAVAAEDHVLNAGDTLNLEGDAGLEGSHVAGVDAEDFAGGQVFDDDFAGARCTARRRNDWAIRKASCWRRFRLSKPNAVVAILSIKFEGLNAQQPGYNLSNAFPHLR